MTLVHAEHIVHARCICTLISWHVIKRANPSAKSSNRNLFFNQQQSIYLSNMKNYLLTWPSRLAISMLHPINKYEYILVSITVAKITYTHSTALFCPARPACSNTNYNMRAYWNASDATHECHLLLMCYRHPIEPITVLSSCHLFAIPPTRPYHRHRNQSQSSSLEESLYESDNRERKREERKKALFMYMLKSVGSFRLQSTY